MVIRRELMLTPDLSTDRPNIRRESRVSRARLNSTPPLILIVLSRLDRGIQSISDGDVVLEKWVGVLHIVVTPPPCI